MSAAEVIREARNVLFERGWTQGQAVAVDRSVCMVGALGVASQRRRGEIKVATDVLRAVTEAVLSESRWPIEWNDTPGRTFSEVIDALDRAEKIAESREDIA